MLTRRRFLSILPAPLIVSALNIMPVKPLCGAEWEIVAMDERGFTLNWDSDWFAMPSGVLKRWFITDSEPALWPVSNSG
jgi:hypothetical protein